MGHQRPLSIMYDFLSLTNSSLLCTKNLYLIQVYHSPFCRQAYIPQRVRCHRPPIWLLALPLNLTYIFTVHSKLSLGSPPYTNSLQSIIKISYLYSIAWVVYPKNPSKLVALFLWWRVVTPGPASKQDYHPLSFVRGCLFNIFAATLHSWRPFLHWEATMLFTF
jgi:hypothetical protein